MTNLLFAILLLAPQAEPVRQAPRRIPAGEHGVGRRVPDLELSDLAGAKRKLSELAPRKPLVVALVSSSCPISRKYAPSLARLEDAGRARGVAFAFVAPIAADSAADLAALAKASGFDGPVLRDSGGAFGALTTTDCFLLDAARTLVYRGAVDDQYGLGYSLDAPRTSYLSVAVDALLAGGLPEISATWAPGCALEPPKREVAKAAVTYHDRISRLVQRACLECHRKGGVGPFPLESHRDLVAHKAMIRKVVESGAMPPWFAGPSAAGEASPWANDRALSASEKAELLAWLSGDLAEGNPADTPLPRKFPEGWQIGKPDAVFELPRDVAVKAEGTMGYVNLEVDTALTEDRWVSAIEIQPTAPDVVHHVLVFVKEGGGKKRVRLEDPLAYFAVYVPGQSSVIYPDGFGRPIPAGSKLKFQMHYTPNGKATTDRTKVGVRFAKGTPRYRVRTASIANPFLKIPAGAEDHAETAKIPVPLEVDVLSYFPHMHLRGKSIRYELVGPGGQREPLLDIPRYDFNWQLSYRYAERRKLPAGSRIEVTGRFDNSGNNPANPDPSKDVRWGEQTHEEMLIGFVEFIVPSENAAAPPGK